MTPSARIQAAIDILTEILETPRPADAVTSGYFRTHRFIGSKDRQAINYRLWRIIRQHHRLSWWIRQTDTEVTGRSLVLADMVFEDKNDVAALDAAFSGAQYAPLPLSDEERALGAFVQGQALESPRMSLRERMECPEWAFAPLQEALGADFEKEMRALLRAAPMDLRVNVLKTTRKEVLAQLQEDGVEAREGTISPFSIRVVGRPAIAQHFLYKEGFIEVQDEGSQMVAVLADAKPGEQVVDYCAGAGGKTLALGAMMNNKGRIVALDVLERRLESGRQRFRRAGLHNIETRAIAETGDKFVKRHAGHFNLVLVDAPCTGTGTWRRDPDRRWRAIGPALPALLTLQAEILNRAQKMVKPGGRLVYATCSLLTEENERQAETFLAANPDFIEARRLRLTPGRDDTDGFFAIVMNRKGAPGAA